MPTDLTTEKMEKLLREKFPPRDKNDPQTVFNSILLSLSSRVDDAEREHAKTRGMVKLLTQRLVEVGIISLPGQKAEPAPAPEAQQAAAPESEPEAGAPADDAGDEEEVVRLDTKQEVKVVSTAAPPPPAPSPPAATPSPAPGE